jgi:hypothetical protein
MVPKSWSAKLSVHVVYSVVTRLYLYVAEIARQSSRLRAGPASFCNARRGE